LNTQIPDTMKSLHPRTLILGAFNESERSNYNRVSKDESEAYNIPLIAYDMIKSNGVDITIEDVLFVMPFLIKQVDKVICLKSTDIEIQRELFQNNQIEKIFLA